MPEVEDIKHFMIGGSDKSLNDELNKIRENIITHMYNLDDDYFNDPEYGSNWITIKEKFMLVIKTLCDEQYEDIFIQHMGGMTYNYDFKLRFLGPLIKETNTRQLVKEVKLEFKHNASCVSELVQFLELYDKDCKNKYDICETSYAEFYYDNYLSKYLESDENLTEPKPEKEIYLKHVNDIKYKHSFFKNLHDNKNNKVKEKKEISNESVTKYLEQFIETFNFEKITKKIIESQTDKMFLLWNCEDFIIQTFDLSKLKINQIKKIDKLYFDVEVEEFQYNIRIRVNWGNGNGLCNPRWKFTFINK